MKPSGRKAPLALILKALSLFLSQIVMGALAFTS